MTAAIQRDLGHPQKHMFGKTTKQANSSISLSTFIRPKDSAAVLSQLAKKENKIAAGITKKESLKRVTKT